jgi:hypothetical protein
VLIIATCVLLAFWLRDYMSLRMSPSRRATRRALAYGAAILLTAVLVWTVAARIGMGDFARRIQSPPVLFLLIAFHFAASVPSVLVRQTQSYNWMWATALLPAPIVWFLLLETTLISGHALISGHDGEVVAPQFSFFVVAVLWALSMVVVIFRTRHIEMPLPDLDFAVLFGSLSHWLAMCALPLALLVTP